MSNKKTIDNNLLDTGCYLTSTLLVFEHNDTVSITIKRRKEKREREKNIVYLWKISETIYIYILFVSFFEKKGNSGDTCLSEHIALSCDLTSNKNDVNSKLRIIF